MQSAMFLHMTCKVKKKTNRKKGARNNKRYHETTMTADFEGTVML